MNALYAVQLVDRPSRSIASERHLDVFDTIYMVLLTV